MNTPDRIARSLGIGLDGVVSATYLSSDPSYVNSHLTTRRVYERANLSAVLHLRCRNPRPPANHKPVRTGPPPHRRSDFAADPLPDMRGRAHRRDDGVPPHRQLCGAFAYIL